MCRSLNLFDLFESPVLFCEEILPASEPGSQVEPMNVSCNIEMNVSTDSIDESVLAEPMNENLNERNETDESDFVTIEEIMRCLTENSQNV